MYFWKLWELTRGKDRKRDLISDEGVCCYIVMIEMAKIWIGGEGEQIWRLDGGIEREETWGQKGF